MLMFKYTIIQRDNTVPKVRNLWNIYLALEKKQVIYFRLLI